MNADRRPKIARDPGSLREAPRNARRRLARIERRSCFARRRPPALPAGIGEITL
jgi:hypothetical protein